MSRVPDSNVTPATASVQGVALGLGPSAAHGAAARVWIPAGGSHRLTLGQTKIAQLLAALLDLKPERDTRLIVLGCDVGELSSAARVALRTRTAILPSGGGLISHLNAWENILLPLGIHNPERQRGSAARVHALLAGFCAEPDRLLRRRPEEMTLYEKKLTSYVRTLLEAPELLLAVDLSGGLEANERERTAGFAAAYHAECATGTFVEIFNQPDA